MLNGLIVIKIKILFLFFVFFPIKPMLIIKILRTSFRAVNVSGKTPPKYANMEE